MEFKYKSTKTFHQAFPVAYRQWRADSHCNVVHGYALSIHLEFGAFDLDARNWVVDFGSLKPLKAQLEDWFDHTMLVAEDDPHREALLALHKLGVAKVTEVERTGCEGLADFVFEHLNDRDAGWLKLYGYGGRVICTKVEVRETDANMAMRTLTVSDWVRFTMPTEQKHVHQGAVAAGSTKPVGTIEDFEVVCDKNGLTADERLAQQAERA